MIINIIITVVVIVVIILLGSKSEGRNTESTLEEMFRGFLFL